MVDERVRGQIGSIASSALIGSAALAWVTLATQTYVDMKFIAESLGASSGFSSYWSLFGDGVPETTLETLVLVGSGWWMRRIVSVGWWRAGRRSAILGLLGLCTCGILLVYLDPAQSDRCSRSWSIDRSLLSPASAAAKQASR
jgi:hypothetical protein